MNKLLIACLLASTCSPLFAATGFYVVIPAQERARMLSELTVDLASAQLPAAMVGEEYPSFDFNTILGITKDTSFGKDTVSWGIIEGALPGGLVLNDDGYISGIPKSPGTEQFKLRATYKSKKGEQTYKVIVGQIVVDLMPSTLPIANVDRGYQQNLHDFLTVTGDTAYNADNVTWSLAQGTLPAGLNLTAEGMISGTPNAQGDSDFKVRANYRAGVAAQDYSIAVQYPYLADQGRVASLTASRTLITAGDTTPIKLTAVIEDTRGLPAEDGERINWSVNAGSLGAASSPTSSGQGTTTLTPPTAAGPITVNASLPSSGNSSSAVVTVVPDLATAQVTELTPASTTGQPANGTGKVTLSATVRDAWGNTVGAGETVSWTTTLGTLSSASSVTNTSGVATIQLTAPGSAGTATVTAKARNAVSRTATVAYENEGPIYNPQTTYWISSFSSGACPDGSRADYSLVYVNGVAVAQTFDHNSTVMISNGYRYTRSTLMLQGGNPFPPCPFMYQYMNKYALTVQKL